MRRDRLVAYAYFRPEGTYARQPQVPRQMTAYHHWLWLAPLQCRCPGSAISLQPPARHGLRERAGSSNGLLGIGRARNTVFDHGAVCRLLSAKSTFPLARVVRSA